jgi:energy-coupling factor transporter ATP-binding protein EcfA2
VGDRSTSGAFARGGQRDLFLSYNSSDRNEVVKVQQLLSLRNISTFYDRTDLTPGQPWFDELETALGQVRGVAVFIGKEGLGTIQKREMQFALARQGREEKEGRPFSVVPVLLPGCDAEMVSGFLALNTWVDLRRNVEDPRAIDSFLTAVEAQAAQPEEAQSALCPYRGLNAFREEDALLFFGREAFSQKLLGQILKQNLVVVIGRSGSGKSSIVQAGLLPLLRLERPPQETWEAVVFSPGSKPFHRLAAQLVPLWSPADRDQTDITTEAEKLGSRLADGEVTLEGFVDLALKHLPDTSRLLAVVDQFEELFAQTAQAELRQRFVDQLLEASRASNLKVVLTLRADFYSKAIELRNLSDAIEAGVVNVGEMTKDELRQAVEEPARRAGLSFESGLVERILDRVEQQPGSLPLLEYALTELWRRRQGGQLTHAAYDAIGGVEGAISKRAEEQFEKLSTAQREIALPALSRLVHVSSAADESADTRRVVSLGEFDADAQAVMRILAAREARLVVMGRDEISGRETVEVAHEALIRGWADLKRWIDKDREFLLWRQQLVPFLEKWRGLGKDRNAALLHGVYLTEARRWLRERGKDLSADERQFIQASERPEIKSRYWKRLATAAATTIIFAAGAWLWWTRTDAYQIQRSIDAGSELVVLADAESAEKWLSTLVLSGRTREALREAHSIGIPDRRGRALASLALTLADSGHSAESSSLIQETQQSLARMDSPIDRDAARADAAVAMAAAGRAAEALSAIGGIKGGGPGGVRVAKVLAKTGKLDKLIEAAGRPDAPLNADGFLANVAVALAFRGHTDEASALTKLIKSSATRAYAVAGVAEALGQAGKTELAGTLAEEALRAAQEVTIEPDRSVTLNWVIRGLMAAGKSAEALRLSEDIREQTSHDQALLDIAASMAVSGRIDDAVLLAQKLRNAKSRPLLFGTIVTAVASAGMGKEASGILSRLVHEGLGAENVLGAPVDLVKVVAYTAEKKPQEALTLARQIGQPSPRRHALAAVADAFKRGGNGDEARQVALEALAPSRDTRQPGNDDALILRADDFATLMVAASNRAMSGESQKAGDEAMVTAAIIADDQKRSQAFATVAQAFARAHAYRQARLTAERCTSSEDKLSAFAAILREYTIQHHPESAKAFAEESD